MPICMQNCIARFRAFRNASVIPVSLLCRVKPPLASKIESIFSSNFGIDFYRLLASKMHSKMEQKSLKWHRKNNLCFRIDFSSLKCSSSEALDHQNECFVYTKHSFSQNSFFDIGRHFDPKKLQKSAQNPFKIHQKCLPKFDQKIDVIVD